jgi:hypothetical protein
MTTFQYFLCSSLEKHLGTTMYSQICLYCPLVIPLKQEQLTGNSVNSSSFCVYGKVIPVTGRAGPQGCQTLRTDIF